MEDKCSEVKAMKQSEDYGTQIQNNKSNKLPQYVAAIAATMAAICGGTALGWTSPAKPLLQSNSTIIPPLAEAEISWAGSLLPLGAVFGAPPTGYLLQRLGRKIAVATMSVPILISFVIILATRSLIWLYAARILAGMGLGGICVSVPVYIAETAEPSIRGELGGFLQIMFNIGVLYVYSLGASEDYTVIASACLVTPFVFLAVFLWMPETPHYHIMKNNKLKASKSLQKLRGKDYDITEELEQVQFSVEESMSKKESLRNLISTVEARRAMVISLGLATFQQLSGINVVFLFSQPIFESAGTTLSPNTCSIIVASVMILTGYGGSLMVDRYGRKIVLILSGGLMALSHAFLGLYFILKYENVSISSLTWLPVVSVIMFMIVYVNGFGPLPWTVMAEVLPSNIKGIGGSLVSAYCWFLAFLVTKVFQNLVEIFGNHYTFWTFSVACVLSCLFVFFVVPETKGKTLQEIQNELKEKIYNENRIENGDHKAV